MTTIKTHLKNLKAALLTLPASGANGFEGLIAITLQAICGVPFRLASSGSQHGLDGDATYSTDSVCFEAKRYEGKIPKNEVLSKIAELSLDCELWVLGATSTLSAQLANSCNRLSAERGISILILDWEDSAVSPFAAALVLADQKANEFLKQHLTKNLALALNALAAIKLDGNFPTHAEKIRIEITAASTGIPLARRANCGWLTNAFSERKIALNQFKQPLCPGDNTIFQGLLRNDIIKALRACFMDPPNETVTCVLAGDGSGKSWVVAQSYLALAEKPITLFLMPSDVSEQASNEFDAWLIAMLIRQTGEQFGPEKVKRWQRKLDRWRTLPRNETRIVLVLDGINQQKTHDWARKIDQWAAALEELGGRLIVTVRAHYFRDIESRIGFKVTEIPVPEWSPKERNRLLELAGIQFQTMQESAAKLLCNPRMLGIAIELYRKGEITDIAEFSVNRMMFEHIRFSQRDSPEPRPAQEFHNKLRKSASEILARVQSGQQDDLKVFENDLNAVKDGRFYVPVPMDPSRYTLTDEGLSLAFGLAIMDLLRVEIRNGRDAGAKLVAFIDPIAALDDTAKVLFAAIIVNAPGNYYRSDIDVVLLKSFADIQNPDQADFDEFKGFARTRLVSFMQSARELCLTGARQANFAWFEAALMTVSRDPGQWQLMTPEVQAWLSLFNDAPELAAFKRKGQDTAEEIEIELSENRAKIKLKIENFSDVEKTFFQRLKLESGNLDALSNFAVYLLAGKTLEPFAAGLMNWCFTAAFNSGPYSPWQKIRHLVQFNRVDWVQTRWALLAQIELFTPMTPSTTGCFALSNVYFATGDSEDETRAIEIRNELRTKDLPFFGRFRLIEGLCSVDPCDPNSIMPQEIHSTSEKVLAMDVGELSASRENTMEQHFFDDARTCLARFNPSAAISKHRELLSNIVNREGQALLYGLLRLGLDIVLLDHKIARTLIDRRLDRLPDALTLQDRWLISQYSLLLAFPYLDAAQQAVQLESLNEGEAFLLDLFDAIKPMLPAQVELLIEAATKATDQNKQIALIGAARNCKGAFTQTTKLQLVDLLRSSASGARAQAYAIIAETVDPDLLKAVVDSDFDASNITEHKNFEARYGSSALLRAANLKLTFETQALERISSMSYGQAALLLGDVARSEIAKRIDNAITRASQDSVKLGPDSRVHFLEGEVLESVRYDVLDSESEKPLTMEAWLVGLGNENNARERQKSRNSSHDDFRSRILQAGLGVALCPMSIEEFEFILGAAPNFRERWFHAFTVMPDAAFRLLNHLAVLLARALSHGSPAKSAKIFERCKFLRASVDVRYCWSDISFVQSMLWQSARSEELDRFRFAELNRARTDHDLAMFVLAALMAKQLPLLEAYIAEKLSSEIPSEIARAIMVIGFSDKTEQNDQRLALFQGKSGLIGKAYAAAIYAYERNGWARHWFALTCQSKCNEDFWCNSVLLAKIVDGRFELWNGEYARTGTPIKLFQSSFENQISSRITKWENERKKKLFGQDPPDRVFLPQ